MWFYWIIVPLAWLVWHIAFRIRVIGRENLIHDRGFVIAPNHIDVYKRQAMGASRGRD